MKKRFGRVVIAVIIVALGIAAYFAGTRIKHTATKSFDTLALEELERVCDLTPGAEGRFMTVTCGQWVVNVYVSAEKLGYAYEDSYGNICDYEYVGGELRRLSVYDESYFKPVIRHIK